MKKLKKICVYTCITGDYDDLHEINNVEENIDYLCFTNNKHLKSRTWKIIYIEDDKLDNQRLSRKIKILGHPYISSNYDLSVWMDASVSFNKKISDFVKTYLNNNPFASFKHHSRDCIYDEAIECIKQQKDNKETILKQVEFLRKERYPSHNGLYEMTVFIKKHNDQIVKKTMNMWFDMICKYSKRDQLSFMYCVWKTGMKIDLIDLDVFNNPWFTWISHVASKEISNYRVYFGNENEYKVENDIQGKYEINDNRYIINVRIPCNAKYIKVEPVKIPCIMYKNIYIENVNSKDITIKNSFNYSDKNIFYNNNSIIEISGNFIKDDIFHFEIELEIMSNAELYNFIGYLVSENNEIIRNFNILKNNNKEYKEKLDSITNSKGWKILEVIRKYKK